MSQGRTIKDYFKRPEFPLRLENASPTEPQTRSPKTRSREATTTSTSGTTPTPVPISDAQQQSLAAPLSSSPLSEPPSSLPSHFESSQVRESSPTLPRKELAQSTNIVSDIRDTNSSFVSGVEEPRNSSVGGSFTGSSQRIIKNGVEVVTGSDDDATDSDESFHSTDEILSRFLTPRASSVPVKDVHTSLSNPASDDKSRQGKSTKKTQDIRVPKYKFTLESLVTHAVDDQQAEAGVEKLRAAYDKPRRQDGNDTPGGNKAEHALREDVLASAFNEEETDLQRLFNAVKRTEAFDRGKSWSFFKQQISTPLAPEFPRESFLPGARESFLREPPSRERAFHSGIIDTALSRGLLPDELLVWVLHSIPSEPRDDLRYAYCRALRSTPAERVAKLVGPDDVDQVFRSLGATKVALDLSAEVVPQSTYLNENKSLDRRYLQSILELVEGVSPSFSLNTRIHILHILFRLSIDASLMKISLICSKVEVAITAMLRYIPENIFETTTGNLGQSLFDTIKDVTLQSKLLEHILPDSERVSLFRCRLAVAFLIGNPCTLVDEVADEVLDLTRITRHLRNAGIESALHKEKRTGGFDYASLAATTSLLNIAIDMGRTNLEFPDKATETRFNADVDALADRIKRIFTAIEDSGASHLRRTETKQSLEALHYRIIFSVRSKPPPKKSFFGNDGNLDNWTGMGKSGSFMDKFLSNAKPNASARSSQSALTESNDGVGE